MLLARFSLAVTALAFGGFGLWLLVSPQALSVVGIALTTPTASIEIRSFYGGLELGLAVFFAFAAARPAWFAPALTAQVAIFFAVVFARLFGIALDGRPDGLIFLLMGSELVGGLLGVFAMARLAAEGSRLRRS